MLDSQGVGPSAGATPALYRQYFASIGSAMAQDQRFTALAAAVLLSILSLGGCVTSTPMDARAEVPGTPKSTGYPAVKDVPPRSEKPAMTADEQLKLKKELTTARDRQVPKSKVEDRAPRAEPVKP